MEATCCGLPLNEDMDNLGLVLECFTIVKTYSDKGEPEYRMLASENLTGVETLGMVVWAKAIVEAGMVTQTILDMQRENGDDE